LFQFNKFLAAVDKMAEADKPDSRVEFKPLVFSTGGMMGENTTKEFDQWKKEMGIGYPRLMTAISISLLTARTIHRNACRLTFGQPGRSGAGKAIIPRWGESGAGLSRS